MKPKSKMKEKPQAEINTVLYAVAPQPKLSTDAIALEGAVVSRGNGIGATSETYLMDCIVGMKHYPDKYFDLAVVDPPYGIGYSKRKQKKSTSKIKYTPKNWDNERPTLQYFNELFRVSKFQIIWGGNYFLDILGYSKGMICWDKCQPEGLDQAMCEFAWTNIDKSAKIVRTSIQQIQFTRIHPTEKPIKLYDWIFKNYSEPGQKVIDTHLGSGSSRISAHKYGLNFTGFEIDEEYYYMQEGRFSKYQSQLTLFNK
jgi:site-specific DNA-methyltransferase (adenine-specific)